MLVDINAFVGHWPYRNLRGNNLKDLLKRMNTYGVDKAMVSNLHGIFYVDGQIANEELFAELNSDASFKDRFILFATIFEICICFQLSIQYASICPIRNIGYFLFV